MITIQNVYWTQCKNQQHLYSHQQLEESDLKVFANYNQLISETKYEPML